MIWKDLEGFDRTWQDYVGLGRIWKDLAGFGWTWQDLEGLGRIWKDLAGFGKTWQDFEGACPSLSTTTRIEDNCWSAEA